MIGSTNCVHPCNISQIVNVNNHTAFNNASSIERKYPSGVNFFNLTSLSVAARSLEDIPEYKLPPSLEQKPESNSTGRVLTSKLIKFAKGKGKTNHKCAYQVVNKYKTLGKLNLNSRTGGILKKKKLLALLALGLVAVKTIVFPIVLKALALVAKKGLVLGLLSLAISGVMFYKNMSSSKMTQPAMVHHYEKAPDYSADSYHAPSTYYGYNDNAGDSYADSYSTLHYP